MNTNDWLVAASAIASAVIALGALIVSIWSAVRSTKAAKDSQSARELASTAQWKMTEHLQVIAEAQATVAKNLQGATPAKGSATQTQGGRLSARLIKVGRSERLVVANVGVESLEVLSVEVPPDIAVSGAPSIDGVDLDPGEDFGIVVAITMGTTLPVLVTMRWRDSRGEQERTQKLSLP